LKNLNDAEPGTKPLGPFETEQEAIRHPAVRAVYAAMRASVRRGVMAEQEQQMLEGACEAAGVEIGAYDRRILAWLAGFEPQSCAVVAGLIARASLPGVTAADLPVIREALAEAYRSERGGRADHAGDDCRAAAYEQLLRRIVTGQEVTR
jgi:hypothetical protein